MLTEDERRTLRVINRLGVVRAADLEERHIPRQRLYPLVRKGKVERQARGIYAASDHPHTTEHALVQVAKRVPNGVICLLTALQFHGLTTQLPAEVWVSLPEKARKPRLDYPRLRVTRFSGAALTEGIRDAPDRAGRRPRVLSGQDHRRLLQVPP